MKIRSLVGLFVMLWALAGWAQTTFYQVTQQIDGSTLSPVPFAGCNGDMLTMGGTFLETTTQWVDGNGDTHTKTNVIDYSNLVANSSTGVSYKVLFSQKSVEVVSDGITTEQTMSFRLKLVGVGPLNNQQVQMELHFTNPNGLGVPAEKNRFTSKCTG